MLDNFTGTQAFMLCCIIWLFITLVINGYLISNNTKSSPTSGDPTDDPTDDPTVAPVAPVAPVDPTDDPTVAPVAPVAPVALTDDPTVVPVAPVAPVSLTDDPTVVPVAPVAPVSPVAPVAPVAPVVPVVLELANYNYQFPREVPMVDIESELESIVGDQVTVLSDSQGVPAPPNQVQITNSPIDLTRSTDQNVIYTYTFTDPYTGENVSKELNMTILATPPDPPVIQIKHFRRWIPPEESINDIDSIIRNNISVLKDSLGRDASVDEVQITKVNDIDYSRSTKQAVAIIVTFTDPFNGKSASADFGLNIDW